MTSVNTNASATTALRTLQQTNKALDATQNRVSTGLKIGEAKDNAAYWAISTTLKSDNKSLSTVKDALNLGAATVDVAYQGLNKAKEVLEEMQKKLTASTAAGVDRNVIQAEVGELQKQLVSIASASTFSGENWLSVNSESIDYASIKNIISSFSRDANNGVTIGSVDVDISTFALFDSSTVANKNGILDSAVGLKGTNGRDIDLGTVNTDGNSSLAGVKATAAAGVVGGTGVAITATTPGTAPVNSVSTYAPGAASITATSLVTGNTFDVIVAKSGGTTQTVQATVGADASAQGVLDAIRTAMAGVNTLPGFTYNNTAGGNLVLTNSLPEANTFSFTIGNFSANTATLAAGTVVAGNAGTAASVRSTALTLANYAEGDTVTLTLNIDGTDRTVTTAPLVKAGGTLALTDISTALNAVLGSSATASIDGSSRLVLTSPTNALRTSYTLKEFVLKDAAGTLKTAAGLPTPTVASHAMDTFSAVTLDDDDHLYFKVQVGTATGAKEVAIDKKLVDEALKNVVGRVAGNIANADQFKLVLDSALSTAGVTGVTATSNGTAITFSTTEVGSKAKLIVSDAKASAGADKVTIDTIDISDAGLAKVGATSAADIKAVVQAYISVVNTALKGVTTAAANLGAVASRIDLQNTFVDTLMDTIDKGVSNLIDADLSEESTRLQALQTKQQLGVQALSIANASTQNILRLFQ